MTAPPHHLPPRPGRQSCAAETGRRSHLLSCTAGGQALLFTARLMAVTEQRCRPGSRPDLTRLADGRLVALLPRDTDTNVVDLQKVGSGAEAERGGGICIVGRAVTLEEGAGRCAIPGRVI